MNLIHTPIAGLLLLEPKVFGDERGHFFESHNDSRFKAAVGPVTFIQDNESASVQGVLRGLHYQTAPKAQGKLVRVIQGSVWDVAVDLRKNSPTLGQHFGVELNENNHLQMWIPAGFAHGFITLSPRAIFQYKVTDYWSKDNERCIQWNDPELNIDWQFTGTPLLSPKDEQGGRFSTADLFD
jgi:dTDP-4-dehydrorhamnose 3,5-epimerase